MLFILAWIAFFVIAILAFVGGDPNRLLAGQDFEGRFCGLEEYGAKDFPFLYFSINLLNQNSSSIAWCSGSSGVNLLIDFSSNFRAVCVKECPDEEMIQGLESSSHFYDYMGASLPILPTEICPYPPESCVPLRVDTKKVFNRYCVPISDDASVDEYVPDEILHTWANWLGDIIIVWPIFLAAIAGAFLFGFLIVVFLRMCADILVWACIITTGTVLVAGGATSYYFSVDSTTNLSPSERSGLLYLAFAVWGCAGVFLVVVLCFCKRIREASAVIRTSALFVQDTPSIIAVPILTFGANIGYIVVWTIICLYLVSATNLEEALRSLASSQPLEALTSFDSAPPSERVTWSDTTRGLLGYHIFMLFWGCAFLVALNQLIIAGSVAAWYFAPQKSNGKKFPANATWRATYYAFRYHLGSLAVGSLLLAILRFIKFFLAHLAAQAQQAQQDPSGAIERSLPFGLGKIFRPLGAANSSYLCLLRSLSYVVSCFERFIKFLNRNAYIQIAITGKNFFKSAWTAFNLVLRNPGRWAIAAAIGRALRFLGVFAITALSILLGVGCIHLWYKDSVSSPILPGIICGVIGLGVAALFMDILSMATDTTLQCYLTDIEIHKKGPDGDLGPQFTPSPLIPFFSGNC